MALPKLFQRIIWHNNTTPAIQEDNLNAMSKGLSDVDDRLIALAGTIMEDVPQIQEDIEELEEDFALIDEKIADATSEANRATTKADEAAASVISAGNKALISEGYAKGTQNGTPVGSSSPYYHNNAEYFKEQARSFTPTGYQDLVDDVAEAQEAIIDIEGEKVSSNDAYVLRQGKGNMVDMSLVGGSIAWNQNVVLPNSTNTSDSHVTITKSSSGTVRVQSDGQNAANDAITLAYDSSFQNYAIAGHVILAIPNATGTSNGLRQKCYVSPDGQWGNVQNLFGSILNTDVISIKKAPSGYGYVNWYLSLSANTTCDITFKPQFFDLTKKLGPTIADYILSLEQATAGAGVAWFRKYFPNVYYGYQSGKIESVNVASRKVTGKNLLPMTLANIKALNTQGIWSGNSFTFNGITYTILTDSNGNITGISANGTASGRAYIYLCDADFGSTDINFDGTVDGYTYSGTLNHNKRFVYYNGGSKKVYILIDTGEVCSNIVFYPQRELGTTATAFEPYRTFAYSFDSSLQLRGIPKLVDNKLSYDGDIYKADGSVTRKYGIVDLGTFAWGRYDTNISGKYRFVSDGIANTVKKPTNLNNKANIICAKYLTITGNDPVQNIDGIAIHTNGNVMIYDSSLATATAENFKTAMSGVYLVYELATPTTESANAYQNPQRAFTDGTEEFVDYGVQSATRDVSIPVGNESEYNTSEVLPISQDYTDGAMEILKEIVASSSDFADFKTKVAAL